MIIVPTNACNKSGSKTVWSDAFLIWQNSPLDIRMNWEVADRYCKSLDLDGKRDWRLPSISALRNLVKDCPGTKFGGDCHVYTRLNRLTHWSSEACSCKTRLGGPGLEGCYWNESLAGHCGGYWSSTRQTDWGRSDTPESAWYLDFDNASVSSGFKLSLQNYVRCVRNAPEKQEIVRTMEFD
jgi:Protein of unknown function (DUF1566).